MSAMLTNDLSCIEESFQIYAAKSDNVDITAVPDSVPQSALKSWWDAYPIPASSPDSLECTEVADLIRNSELGEKDFVVVDVRRNDHAVSVPAGVSIIRHRGVLLSKW